jgi:hypothetical protein
LENLRVYQAYGGSDPYNNYDAEYSVNAYMNSEYDDIKCAANVGAQTSVVLGNVRAVEDERSATNTGIIGASTVQAEAGISITGSQFLPDTTTVGATNSPYDASNSLFNISLEVTI